MTHPAISQLTLSPLATSWQEEAKALIQEPRMHRKHRARTHSFRGVRYSSWVIGDSWREVQEHNLKPSCPICSLLLLHVGTFTSRILPRSFSVCQIWSQNGLEEASYRGVFCPSTRAFHECERVNHDQEPARLYERVQEHWNVSYIYVIYVIYTVYVSIR